MIELGITPTTITVGRPTDLRLIAHNVGDGECIEVVVRIALPLGLRMVGGSGRVRIPRLGPGSAKAHPFRVIAAQPGDYRVTTPNFSYQDAMGFSRHVRLDGWTVTAVAGSAPRPTSVPTAACCDRGADPDRPAAVPGKVFISYRQDDTWELADHVHSELCREFGTDRVYLDRRNRQPGSDFRDRFTDALNSTAAMVVLIGRRWNPPLQVNGLRRFDNPDDYVRWEISTGLRARIPIIPVLVDATPMPDPRGLPEDIRAVTFRERVDYHRIGGEYAIEEILNAVRPHLLGPST